MVDDRLTPEDIGRENKILARGTNILICSLAAGSLIWLLASLEPVKPKSQQVTVRDANSQYYPRDLSSPDQQVPRDHLKPTASPTIPYYNAGVRLYQSKQ